MEHECPDVVLHCFAMECDEFYQKIEFRYVWMVMEIMNALHPFLVFARP